MLFVGEWKGQRVAYKCFKLADIVGDVTKDLSCDLSQMQRRYAEFEIELNLLTNLKHPYIIRCFGAVFSPQRVGFIMELCTKGG